MAHKESPTPPTTIPIATLTPNDEASNPWASTPDISQTHTVLEPEEKPVISHLDTLPSSTSFDGGFVPPALPKADPDVLNEFDPLTTDPVEKDAQEAWASAEGHLPPPLPVKESPFPPEKDNEEAPPSPPPPQSAPAVISSFPSLASLARTLTRSPKRAITPPLPVPPPRTSSLRHAHHASMPAITSNPALPAEPPKAQEAVAKENRAATSSPIPVRVSTSPAVSEGHFDFQRFLDQMKSKGAEPIAGYLRRYAVLRL